jgi:hypothetical protein
MSNIALTPNASGTGTFTLASPNSNTNRTLTLPDATGTMFNQGNILGTVSQTSEVPTGAVLEKVSNANGTCVKFADGTMICTRDISVNHTATGITSSDWAAAFASSVIGVSIKFSPTSTLARIDRFNNCHGQASTTAATFAVGTNGTAAETLTHTMTGIGRWYV